MENRTSWKLAGAMACMVAVGGCGWPGLEPRFTAVHNVFSSMGLSQTGPIHEGNLAEEQEARIPHRLSPGTCYSFVALGAMSIDELQLRVVDDAGADVATSTMRDRQTAVQFCPEREADYLVVVRAVDGHGDYMLSSWSGGGGGGGGHAVAHGGGAGGGGSRGAASCSSPIPVRLGQPMQGNTNDGGSALDPTCARTGANEQVYTLRLQERAVVQAVVQSSFDGVVYIRRDCMSQASELACNDDSPAGNTSRSEISVALDPGTYFIVVDGFGNGSQGGYELVVSTSTAPSVDNLCRDAEALTPGRPMQGTTMGAIDSFTATCGGNARSPDRVYRLDVAQRSRMRVRAETSDHDGVVHVRRDCAAASSEIACDDDFGDNRHSLVTGVVDPGTYYVVADGFGSGAAGAFTLQADVAPESGGNAAGDDCRAPQTVGSGTASIDTLGARDDFHGSCGGSGAPDVVHRLEVARRSRVRVRFTRPEFNGVAYLLQRSCEQGATEVACGAFSRGGQAGGIGMMRGGPMPPTMPSPRDVNAPVLDTILAPGTYFLVVDGSQADSFGSVDMEVLLEDPEQAQRACREAPLLQSGRSVSGTTQGREDRFQASCANGAQSGDMLYRIQLRMRSLVRINVTGTGFDTALHLRRDCADASSELACNDDDGDATRSRIETALDPGTYYVIVDGFGQGAQGAFTLTYDAYRENR